MVFFACVHVALFLALSLSPGNSLVSSWCDHRKNVGGFRGEQRDHGTPERHTQQGCSSRRGRLAPLQYEKKFLRTPLTELTALSQTPWLVGKGLTTPHPQLSLASLRGRLIEYQLRLL